MSKSYILSRMDWAKAYRDYEALKVGNENLLPYFTDSGFWNIPRQWEIVSESKVTIKELGTNPSISSKTIHLKADTDYTFTFNSDYARYSLHDAISKKIIRSVSTQGSDIVTFNSNETEENSVYLSLDTWSRNIDKVRSIWELKLEEGKKSTPYTPSPSDINAKPFPTQLANDMYMADKGNWNKAQRDYEALKVGKENFFEPLTSNKWTISPYVEIIGDYHFSLPPATNVSTTISIPVYGTEKYTISWEGTGRVCLSVYNLEEERIYHRCSSETLSLEIPIAGVNLNIAFSKSSNQIEDKVVWKNIKLERGSISTPFTPSPDSINASPFTVKLAQDYYQQQTEINELRNAILQLGGN